MEINQLNLQKLINRRIREAAPRDTEHLIKVASAARFHLESIIEVIAKCNGKMTIEAYDQIEVHHDVLKDLCHNDGSRDIVNMVRAQCLIESLSGLAGRKLSMVANKDMFLK